MASKNYAIHNVKISRPDEHVGKTYDHTGWAYEKGDFIKKVNTSEEHAQAMNEQAHNTRQMYYLIEEETPVEEVVTEPAAAPKKKSK